jgi:hypothetical protein
MTGWGSPHLLDDCREVPRRETDGAWLHTPSIIAMPSCMRRPCSRNGAPRAANSAGISFLSRLFPAGRVTRREHAQAGRAALSRPTLLH